MKGGYDTVKKFISIILAIIISAFSVMSVGAVVCDHQYVAEFHEANCQSAEYTVYTCALCSDTYTKYGWEYEDTGAFAIVLGTDRNDDTKTLTLTANLLNNPGILIARMTVEYNSEVLRPVSFNNGNVWADADLSYGVNLTKNPFSIYTEKYSTEVNVNSGIYYTVTFEILDPDGDYGFGFTAREKDFVNWDGAFFKPEVVDLTGKKETGNHNIITNTVLPTCTENGYTEKHCSFCDYSVTENITDPLGHNYSAPAVAEHSVGTVKHGYLSSICAGCGDEIKTLLPFKGDVNNDEKINAVDANIMTQIVLGTISAETSDKQYSADINNDNKINAVDVNLIKALILGM